jgi:hypothetical protein
MMAMVERAKSYRRVEVRDPDCLDLIPYEMFDNLDLATLVGQCSRPCAGGTPLGLQ